jgi:hypothetical protein
VATAAPLTLAELDRLTNLESANFRHNEALIDKTHPMYRSTMRVVTVLMAICKDHGGSCVFS